MVDRQRAPRREIRDRDGVVLWRSDHVESARPGVVITVRHNKPTTATGLLPGDRLYEDGVLVYTQEGT